MTETFLKLTFIVLVEVDSFTISKLTDDHSSRLLVEFMNPLNRTSVNPSLNQPSKEKRARREKIFIHRKPSESPMLFHSTYIHGSVYVA